LSLGDGVVKGADKLLLLPDRSALRSSESFVGPLRLRACAWQSSAVRHSRSAHDLYSAKVCYRYHPLHGVAVQLVRYLRRGSSAVVIVRLLDNSQLAIPEWMLKPETCEGLKLEAKPRISVNSLLNVRKLIGGNDAQSCAESASGGQDAQQGESGDTAAQDSLRRRRALEQTTRGGAGEVSKSLEGTAGECCQEG